MRAVLYKQPTFSRANAQLTLESSFEAYYPAIHACRRCAGDYQVWMASTRFSRANHRMAYIPFYIPFSRQTTFASKSLFPYPDSASRLLRSRSLRCSFYSFSPPDTGPLCSARQCRRCGSIPSSDSAACHEPLIDGQGSSCKCLLGRSPAPPVSALPCSKNADCGTAVKASLQQGRRISSGLQKAYEQQRSLSGAQSRMTFGNSASRSAAARGACRHVQYEQPKEWDAQDPGLGFSWHPGVCFSASRSCWHTLLRPVRSHVP